MSQEQQNAIALHSIFENTFNPDGNARQQAEAALKAAEAQPMFVWTAFQIAASGDVRLEIRQAAAIRLKNRVSKEDWNEENAKILDEEKAKIKENLLAAIIQAPSKIRNQLLAVTKAVVLYDYPERWPNIVQMATASLKADTLNHVTGALSVLRTIAKRFEFSASDEERQPLIDMVEHLFPTLCDLFTHVNSLPINEEIGLLQKLLCKMFWSAVHLEVPPSMLANPDGAFKKWMECFRQVLVADVAITEWTSSVWQAKKWIGHIITRLIDRYGSPRGLDKEEMPFHRAFVGNFATGFLQCFFHIIELYANNQPVAPKILCLSLKYVALTVNNRPTYTAIAQKFNWLVSSVLFPLMCFDNQDAQLWQDNPQEYIRKLYDPMEDYFNPRSGAMEVLMKLVKPEKQYHHKDGLPQLLTFLMGKLQIYKQNPGENVRVKDGCLYTIGHLKSLLRKRQPYKDQIEGLLVEHVLPEMESSQPFLREKAVWCAAQYSKIEWRSTENYGKLFSGTVKLMRDQELPVRVQAGMALKYVVLWKGGEQAILPELKNLIHELFKLFSEIDSDELIQTLEILIDRFGDSLTDAAVEIFDALAQHCQKILPEVGEEDDVPDEDELDELDASAMASAACLRAMYALLEAVSHHPQVYQRLEGTVVAICEMLLVKSRVEFMDEVLELIAHYLYLAKCVPPNMWRLFPLIYIAFTEWAGDYFTNMLNVLDNFITLGAETFTTGTCQHPHPAVNGKRYISVLQDMLTKVVSDEDNQTDLPVVPKLVSAMLQHTKTCWPDRGNWVPGFFDIILKTLQTNHKDMALGTKILCIDVIADGFYFDMPLTLTYLNDRKLTTVVMDEWLNLIQKMTRRYDKKVTSLGLTSIMDGIATHGIDCLQPRDYFNDEKVVNLIGVNIKMILECHEQALEEAELGDEEEEDEESLESGDADSKDDSSDEGDVDPEDDIDTSGLVVDDKFKKLLQEAQDSGDNWFTDFDLEDDDGYTSLIDKVEESVYFCEIFHKITNACAPLANSVTGQMTADAKNKLDAARAYGQQQMEKRAKQEQEEQQKKQG
eukprot:TRINITY_DN32690_c0_g1_i1.p1 TRINITY_DN32690_c0_g1~~TRINITY_DN32690_c0_g1_i1.p1  ORF type:complete len:1055 (+),score=159.38 TRINITY_DN32690_c0_g1_i1:69-3233(+)